VETLTVRVEPLAAKEIESHISEEMGGGWYGEDKFEEPVNTLFARLSEIAMSGCATEVVVTSAEMGTLLTDAAEEMDASISREEAEIEEWEDDYGDDPDSPVERPDAIWCDMPQTQAQVRRFITAWRAA
jgi:hypothetical protein